MPLIDAHVHAFGTNVSAISKLMELERSMGYDTCCYLSCPCMGDGALQNILGICLKLMWKDAYAFGGISYDTGESPEQQAKTLLALGMDGIKMIEQKPTIRRTLQIPFSDPRYDGLYALLSREQVPLLAHIADPEDFWDESRIPPWARAAGYDYSRGGYVSKEQLYSEVEDVVSRFPRLPLILAHFYFMSADMQRLDAFLQRHENVCLDLTSGTEMYFNFSAMPSAWRDFFLRYRSRLIYGTDNSNTEDKTELENAYITNRFQLGFLTSDEKIPAWDRFVQGISLPRDVCRDILGENFIRLAGAPRSIDGHLASAYIRACLNRAPGKEEEETMRHVLMMLEARESQMGGTT